MLANVNKAAVSASIENSLISAIGNRMEREYARAYSPVRLERFGSQVRVVADAGARMRQRRRDTVACVGIRIRISTKKPILAIGERGEGANGVARAEEKGR